MTTTPFHPSLRRTITRGAVVAAAAASLAVPLACSSTPDPAGGQRAGGGPAPGEQAAAHDGGAPASVPDACKILSADDLTPLFGSPAGPPEAGLNVTGNDESFCDYTPAAHELGKVTLLQVQIFNSPRFLPRSGYANDNPADAKVAGASEAFSTVKPNTVTVNAVVNGKRLVVSFTPGDKNAGARLDDTVKMTSTIAGKL